jgi:hypothetical protein
MLPADTRSATLRRDVVASRGVGAFERVQIYCGEHVEVTGSTDYYIGGELYRDFLIETPDGRYSEVPSDSLGPVRYGWR